jgi:hypothetical protein
MKQYIKNRQWVIIWGMFVFGITIIPYLLGFALQGVDWRFSGFVFGVEDGNSYIAKMMNGAYGDWLFRTPFTTLKQSGILAFIPYLVLGKLTTEPGQHEQLLALFQGFRLAGILLYCLAAYDFFRLFSSNDNLIRWGVIISTIWGGLGWMTLFGLKGSGYSGLPVDLYSPETFGFLSLFGLPHLAFSRALLAWGWCLFIKTDVSQTPWRRGLVIGILWLFMGLFQPLSVVTAWAGMGGAWLVSRILEIIQNKKNFNILKSQNTTDRLKTAVVACAISSFWIIYNVLAIIRDPFLKGWSEQNIIRSPALIDYFFSFCLVLVPAGFGFYLVLRKKIMAGAMLVGFVILFPLLAYFPINLQRRLPDGIWWILIALSIIGIGELGKKWRTRLQALVMAGIFTSVFLLIGGVFSTLTPTQPVYAPIEKIQAIEAIGNNWGGQGRPIVLADYQISNIVPAWINAKVLIGHGPESVNLQQMQEIVEDILTASTLDTSQIATIQSIGINYAILEKSEQLDSWLEIGEIIFHQKDVWVVKLLPVESDQ